MDKKIKRLILSIVITTIIISAAVGGAVGWWSASLSSYNLSFSQLVQALVSGKKIETKNDKAVGEPEQNNINREKIVVSNREETVISAVEKASPAVVSIIITKDLPVLERYYSNTPGKDFLKYFFGEDFGLEPQYRQKGTEKREIGGGTGVLVSADGYIVTNRHVVFDDDADYTVLMNDETEHQARVLARDQLNDVAIIKIEGNNLPFIDFGDSHDLKVGQSVISIGNALGEFRNTVSTGIISGLARNITAGGQGFGSEQLINLIQTDASINPGNSGGPLLNLSGQIIGINTAIAQGAQNIGFAIPINEVKTIFESVRTYGKIIRPWLGVRYVLINKVVAEQNKMPIDHGALIVHGATSQEPAVISGSPADKAGLVENDIIFEINNEKIDTNNTLARVLGKYKPGEEITLKVMHDGKEKEIKVKLEEMK